MKCLNLNKCTRPRLLPQIALLLLSVLLLSLFSACNAGTEPPAGSESSADMTEEPTAGPSADSPAESGGDPSQVLGDPEEEKAELFSLLQETFHRLPRDPLSPFEGDYTMEWTSSVAADAALRFWQRGNVSGREYPNGRTHYTVATKDHLIDVYRKDGVLYPNYYEERKSEDPSLPALFGTELNFDFSVWSQIASLDPAALITEEDLTVEGSVLKLSDEAVDGILLRILTKLGFPELQARQLVNLAECEAVYTKESGAPQFALGASIRGKDGAPAAEILVELTVSRDENGAPTLSFRLDSGLESETVPLTQSLLIECGDLRFDGDLVVGMTLRQVSSVESALTVGDLVGKTSVVIDGVTVFDGTDEKKTTLSSESVHKSVTSYGIDGEGGDLLDYENRFTLDLTLDRTAKSGHLETAVYAGETERSRSTASFVTEAPDVDLSDLNALVEEIAKDPETYFGILWGWIETTTEDDAPAEEPQ